jgi:hypothetical protein
MNENTLQVLYSVAVLWNCGLLHSFGQSLVLTASAAKMENGGNSSTVHQSTVDIQRILKI